MLLTVALIYEFHQGCVAQTLFLTNSIGIVFCNFPFNMYITNDIEIEFSNCYEMRFNRMYSNSDIPLSQDFNFHWFNSTVDSCYQLDNITNFTLRELVTLSGFHCDFRVCRMELQMAALISQRFTLSYRKSQTKRRWDFDLEICIRMKETHFFKIGMIEEMQHRNQMEQTESFLEWLWMCIQTIVSLSVISFNNSLKECFKSFSDGWRNGYSEVIWTHINLDKGFHLSKFILFLLNKADILCSLLCVQWRR